MMMSLDIRVYTINWRRFAPPASPTPAKQMKAKFRDQVI